MIRVGIIGCGKIADQHAYQISRIHDCRIVATCDREHLMAEQLAERFGIPGVYDDVARMLADAKPDVVHITTPPHGHFALGQQCMEAGCNVYIEKPFTIDYPEAKQLIELAGRKSLKVTVGHNVQFSYESRLMRKLVKQGFLGGTPVHMESMYCYDLEDGYARAFLTDRNHWLRRLPGGLLQNLISHGIAKIAEFLPGDSPTVLVNAFVGPVLRQRGEKEIIDELRVIINSEDTTTAYFTFSSRLKPHQNLFRLYGPRNSLIVDQIHQTVIKVPGKSYKAQLNYVLPSREFAKEYRRSSLLNIRRFLKRDLHMDTGMKYLIESFYRSITENTPPPIPYREILLVARIMDDIFRQIR
jgi:predicted dehydrogenase